MLWFTSDQHFSHENIIKYCNRPFKSAREMNDEIIRRFNSVVGKNDHTFHLGDFCLSSLYNYHDVLKNLNGTHWFVVGNHDRISFNAALKAGFSAVLHEATIKIGKTYVRLSHYPYKPTFWERWWYFLKKGKHLPDFKKRPANQGGWLIHGHTHKIAKVDPKKKSIHIGVDAWDFYPVSINQIANLMDEIGR